MSGSFLDTNVIIYIAPSDAAKVISQGGVVNVQVLNELAAIARRRMRLI